MALPEDSARAGATGAPEPDGIAYRRLVVPLDGSELAEQALPYAEALGHLMGTPL